MSEESLNPSKEDKKSKSEVNKQGPLIYLGPNLPSSMLNRFTVFSNGMPSYLNKVFEDCPDVQKLFVPVEKLAEVLEKINKTGTPYHTWYGNVTAFVMKGVK